MIRHSTKYYLKLTIAILVWLFVFFGAARVGIKENMTASILSGLAVGWIVWPSVWNATESKKSEIISYNVFALIIIAVVFVYERVKV